jgi:hypothetical protein
MTRQWFSLGKAATVAAIAASGLSACGVVPTSTLEDDTVLSERISSVRLDSASGGVTLRGEDNATKVSVHRVVEYRGDRTVGHRPAR